MQGTVKLFRWVLVSTIKYVFLNLWSWTIVSIRENLGAQNCELQPTAAHVA